MRGWLKSTIGELCDTGGGEVKTGPFGSQLHQSDYQETGIPVVMPADIINGKIDQSRIARVSQSHVDRLHKHELSKLRFIPGRSSQTRSPTVQQPSSWPTIIPPATSRPAKTISPSRAN